MNRNAPKEQKGKGHGFSPFFLRGHNIALAIGLFWLIGLSPCKTQVVDSIRYFMKQDGSFMAKFDTRHSFISSRHGRIFGLKFGVDFADRVSFGGGINWLTNRGDLERELSFPDTTVNGGLAFWYLSPFFEYTFFEDPNWKLSMPVRIGLGGAEFSYWDPEKEKKIKRGKLLFSYEPVLTAQYKFLRYFGVGTGIGYRIIALDRSLIPSRFDQDPYRFTSPIYIFRFKVFFGKMYRDVFPQKEEGSAF